MPPHEWALLHEDELMLSRDRRAARGMLYASLIASGAASSVVNATFTVSFGLKAVGLFLILGGTISLVGHLRSIPAVEAIGLPLLISALGALALTAFVGGAATPPRYFVASLCLGFTFSLFARWRDLRTLTELNKSFRSSR